LILGTFLCPSIFGMHRPSAASADELHCRIPITEVFLLFPSSTRRWPAGGLVNVVSWWFIASRPSTIKHL
jgi:hypothetical protein